MNSFKEAYKDVISKAFESYAKKFGVSVVEASILFVNVLSELEAAQQSVEPTGSKALRPVAHITDEDIEAINLI